MADPADIFRVQIERSESDEYSTDLAFTFTTAGGHTYVVDGICAAPDIFEIKAHTLAKILAGTVSLPRSLDFGAPGCTGRYVHFTFRAGVDGALSLRCSACADTAAPQGVRNPDFEVRDREAMAQLLSAFRYLDGIRGGQCAWNVSAVSSAN